MEIRSVSLDDVIDGISDSITTSRNTVFTKEFRKGEIILTLRNDRSEPNPEGVKLL
jgi:hypothetical protein